MVLKFYCDQNHLEGSGNRLQGPAPSFHSAGLHLLHDQGDAHTGLRTTLLEPLL